MTTPTPDENAPAISTTVPGVDAMRAAETAFLDELRQLAAELQRPPYSFDPANLRKGVITAVNAAGTPPTVTLQISGDTAVDIAGVRYIDSYSPQVGDTALVLKQGTDIVAFGKIAEAAASGWTQASLAAGFSHNGDSQGNLEYRRTWDGGFKMQWRGAVARSSGTTIVSALGTDFRPATKRTVLAARGYGGGSVAVQIEFTTAGAVSMAGGTFSLGSTGAAGDAHAHSHGGAVALTSFAETHTHAGPSITAPDWISFNNVEYFL